MRDRYDGSRGKEAGMQNTRQRRYEAEHSAKNQFVKRQQAELDRHAGRAPNLKGESLEMNAYMCNNGEHAQELAVGITKGLDKVAFPVKGSSGNES